MKNTAKSILILFIGNSFTARNNLPGMIVELATARGVEVRPKLLSMGGASLRMHWNKGEAPKLIATGKFDYIVLQEQSTLPIKNAARSRENILLFDEPIRAAKSKMALYMTWARESAPLTQKALTECYESVGREIDAIVVPVGRAWELALAETKHPDLHDKDGSHPSRAGSYLAACTFLETLFPGRPAAELPLIGLNTDEAMLLQKIARRAVQVSGK